MMRELQFIPTKDADACYKNRRVLDYLGKCAQTSRGAGRCLVLADATQNACMSLCYKSAQLYLG